jgi:DNA invertase Pin-like site-specific DNA recombinase
MHIGYARVSRGDHQDIAAQLASLKSAGCEQLFEEEASGGDNNRPALAQAIAALVQGDVLVVWKLDRLSRSLRDLLFRLEHIEAAGAGFRSLTEAIGLCCNKFFTACPDEDCIEFRQPFRSVD